MYLGPEEPAFLSSHGLLDISPEKSRLSGVEVGLIGLTGLGF